MTNRIRSIFLTLIATVFVGVLAEAQTTAPTSRPTTQPAGIVGVWYQPVRNMPLWKSRGINTLIRYEGESGAVTVDQWADAAKSNGLQGIPQWNGTGGGAATQTRATNDLNVIGVINTPDEPDGAGNTSAQIMQQQYASIKQATTKQVFLNVDGRKMSWRPASDYVDYCKATDVIMVDHYVLNYGEGPGNIPAIGANIIQLQQASGGKPVIPFIECSNQGLNVQQWVAGAPGLASLMRGPLVGEFNAELDAIQAAGAAGVAYFPDVIGVNFVSFDGVPNDIAAAMTLRNMPLLVPTSSVPALQPTSQPTTQPSVPATQSTADPFNGSQLILNGRVYKLTFTGN